MVYFASPGSALAGLEAAIDYYNAAETVDGRWFAFIGDSTGRTVGHSDPSMIGRDVQDLFCVTTFDAATDGGWVESESLRVWVTGHDGYVFGSGLRRVGRRAQGRPPAQSGRRPVEGARKGGTEPQ